MPPRGRSIGRRGGERSGHDIAVTVDIDAGVEVEDVKSVSHVVDVTRRGPSRVSVTLSPNDRIPNKDLVLRYKVAGRELKTALMTAQTEKEKYFALVLQPPERLTDCPRMAREMVFVLDCSGSMSGWPIAKAKEARHGGIAKIWARRKLRHLADLETHSPSSELTEEMIAVSLETSVQCRYTAFVAVDSTRRTEGDHGVTVAVPVPVPEGVRYETTVTE